MPLVFFYYTYWHYLRAPRDIFQIWKNFLWFFFNFFSIPLLLLSLFAPFQKLDEKPRKGFDLQAIGESLVVNTLMRVVGFGVRGFTVLMGLTFLTVTFFGGIVFLICWLLMPLLVVFLIIAGAFLIIV